MKLSVLLFILSCCFQSIAQDYTRSPYSYPNKLPAYHEEKMYNEYRYALDSMYYNSDIFKRVGKDPNLYSNISVIKLAAFYSGWYKKKLLESHQLYYDWKEAEDYVKELLKLIQPKSYEDLDSVRVYIMRSSEMNAFALDVNEIYVTSGLLAEINSEAALTYVLGHELGHIEYSDAENQAKYRIEQAADISSGGYFSFLKEKKLKKRLEIKSQMSELKADSFGIQRMKKMDFDLNEARGSMELMGNNQKIWLAKLKKRQIKSLFNSHPGSDDRIEQLNRLGQDYSGNRKSSYSSSIFNSISSKAKYEKLINWRENSSFYNLVEDAFRYHLQDPFDENYIYFALEGLRQLLAYENELEEEEFLMHLYEKHPNGNKEGTLAEVLPFYGVDINKLKGHPLVKGDQIALKTYQGAWDYFEKVAISNEITESYLSLGLHYIETNPSESDRYLQKYVSQDGAINKPSAYYFLGDSVIENIGKSYVVVNNREWYVGRVVWELYNNQDRYHQLYSYSWHAHMEKYVAKDQALFVADYKYEDYKDFIMLRHYLGNSMNLSRHFYDDRAKKRDTYSRAHFKALWFWPEYYQLMSKYQIAEPVLLDERRIITPGTGVLQIYDYHLYYDGLKTIPKDGFKEKSTNYSHTKRFRKHKKMITSNTVYRKIYKTSLR